MKLDALTDESYAVAKSKGWHDADAPKASFADRSALMISELSEALEEHRKGVAPTLIYFPAIQNMVKEGPEAAERAEELASKESVTLAEMGYKPEGIGIELADVVIRIGDASGVYGLDLQSALSDADPQTIEAMQESPTGLHDPGQYTFGGWFCEVAGQLLQARYAWESGDLQSTSSFFAGAAWIIANWCTVLGVNLTKCIEIKTAFNKTRSHRHGGKLL